MSDTDVQQVSMPDSQKPDKVYLSRKYMVLLYERETSEYPNMKRMSVCRVQRNQHGYVDGLTWDELQSIKRDIGFADAYAVEVYPRDCDIVNVANFRHLWILEKPLDIGWFKDDT